MARKRKEQSPIIPSATDSQQALAPSDLSVNRRKKSAATRIGRACDRCQHRKLACDPAPEGCTPCRKVNAWCTVTDPLTGTPTYRGEFEYLERAVKKQRTDIELLLARLRSFGEDVDTCRDDDPGSKRYQDWSQVKATGDTRPWDHDDRQHNPSHFIGLNDLGGSKDFSNRTDDIPDSSLPLHSSANAALCLPDVRSGVAGESYLGAPTGRPTISLDPDSKLNMLGWEINIASFMSDTPDGSEISRKYTKGASYDRSYQSFIATAFGGNSKIESVQSPTKDEAITYAESYFSVLNAFLPILHKPTFMHTLLNFYDDRNFIPSSAEKVMLYVVFASICYQDAIRNWEDPKRQQDLHSRSNIYYHYSLGFFRDLMEGNMTQDVQALTVLAAHIRNFPRPEAGWVISSIAFHKAIELGLHKSIRQGTPSLQQMNGIELEMRGRIFWSILGVLVDVSGKLGRPMPIRDEDFDVQLPQPLDDEMSPTQGKDNLRMRNPTFLIGLESLKMVPHMMYIYRNLYSARRSAKEYTQFVADADKRIKQWLDQLPRELMEQPRENYCARIFIKCLNLWYHEFRLLLHHPSLSMTKSIQFNETNLRVCLESSRGILQQMEELQQIKGLDSTWYNCAIKILSIQTTLYGHGQFKDELTREILHDLRTDMKKWLSIMGDLGGLLGCDRRLQIAVHEQISSGMAQLESNFAAKNSRLIQGTIDEKSGESRGIDSGQSVIAQPVQFHGNNPYDLYVGPSHQYSGYEHTSSYPAAPANTPGLNPYPNMAQYNYPEPSPSTFATPQPVQSAISYPVTLANQALSSTYQQQAHPGVASAMPNMYAPTSGNYPTTNAYGADSRSWMAYTSTIPNGIGMNEYNPASALLQLGGRPEETMNGNPAGEDGTGGIDTSLMSGGAGQMWPIGIQHPGRGGS